MTVRNIDNVKGHRIEKRSTNNRAKNTTDAIARLLKIYAGRGIAFWAKDGCIRMSYYFKKCQPHCEDIHTPSRNDQNAEISASQIGRHCHDKDNPHNVQTEPAPIAVSSDAIDFESVKPSNQSFRYKFTSVKTMY